MRRPWASWFSALALGGCPLAQAGRCPARPDDVVRDLVAAQEAFVHMDPEAFEDARAEALAGMTCLSAPMTPAQAALAHRIEALDAFLVDDTPRVLAAFAAASRADPDVLLPTDLAPPGNLLRTRYDEARWLPMPPVTPLTLPPDTTAQVDGRDADSVPVDQPALTVYLDGAGEVVGSVYHAPGAPQPTLEVLEVTPIKLPEIHPERVTRVAAGGLAVTSAALWTGALLTRRHVMQVGDDIAAGVEPDVAGQVSLGDLMDRTTKLGYAAQVTTGLALGLGVVVFTVDW